MIVFPCSKMTRDLLVLAGLVLFAAAAQAGSMDHGGNVGLVAPGGYQGEPVLELWGFNGGGLNAQDAGAIDGSIVGAQAFLAANHGVREWHDETLSISVNGTEGLLPYLAAGVPEPFPPSMKLDGIALLAFVLEDKEASVPEPTTWLVLATGLVLLCFARLAPMASQVRGTRSYVAWKWRWRWRAPTHTRWPARRR